MALHVSSVSYEHREVVLRDKPAEMLAASPKGTVPVLVPIDSPVLEESIDIMRWALGQSDPENWLSRGDDALVAANDADFKHHLDRYKYSARFENTEPEDHRGACMTQLGMLDQRLTDGEFLCGVRRGFADIAIFPFVRQFATTDRGWFDQAPVGNVRRWLNELTGSPLFAAIMTKHNQWQVSGQRSVKTA